MYGCRQEYDKKGNKFKQKRNFSENIYVNRKKGGVIPCHKCLWILTV
jgi:hypothetical protein